MPWRRNPSWTSTSQESEYNVRGAPEEMTVQAEGHLSPLHQLANRKVNGTQFAGFPFKEIRSKEHFNHLHRITTFLPSSYVRLLMDTGDHPCSVVLTLAAKWNHRWRGAGRKWKGSLLNAKASSPNILFNWSLGSSIFFNSPRDSSWKNWRKSGWQWSQLVNIRCVTDSPIRLLD